MREWVPERLESGLRGLGSDGERAHAHLPPEDEAQTPGHHRARDAKTLKEGSFSKSCARGLRLVG